MALARQRLSWSLVVLVAGSLLVAACGPPPQSSPSPETKTAAAAVAAIPKAGWEQKWQALVTEAKKEGSVALYTAWPPNVRVAVGKAFRDRFGVDLQVSAFGLGFELVAKVQAEKRAGLYVADVFGVGGGTMTMNMKPEGLLRPIEPLLILPEVLDPAAWRGGKIPFYDKDRYIMPIVSALQRNVFYNNTMVKEGEITGFKDVLKPQYQGKIVLIDPTVSGGGASLFTILATQIEGWNVEAASDFLRRLVKEQQAVIVRDPRQQVEWVARGKYAIGVGVDPPMIAEFLAAGAPISQAYLKEGAWSSPAQGSLGVPAVSAHSNAAIVFVNWILSKEGQTVFSHSWRAVSPRVDVPGPDIHPSFLPRPGEWIGTTSEEFQVLQSQLYEVSKRIIAEAAK